MKFETIAVYGALTVALIFVVVVIYATLKSGSDEDDRTGCDEIEE